MGTLEQLEWGRLPQPERAWEQEMLDVLLSHGEREGSALSAYRDVAQRSEDRGVRYLTALILEDEQRHHRLVAEMVNELRSEIDEQRFVPSAPWVARRPDPALTERIDALLALERGDARALRHLRRRARGAPEGSVLPLLVSLLAHDTARHIAILRFLRRRVSGGARGRRAVDAATRSGDHSSSADELVQDV
jgi:hypothetical protein